MTKSSAGQNHHHRSSLKQKNKPFKGTTKAKAANSRGKVDHKTLVSSSSHASNVFGSSLNRVDRKNQGKVKRLVRKAVLDDQKRIFTGPEGVSRTIALIPLTSRADAAAVLSGLNVTDSKGAIYVEAFKQNLRFFTPSRHNLLEVLDAAAAVDTLLFIVNVEDECIDQLGVDFLEVLRSQGLCTAVACIQGLESLKATKHHDHRQNWLNSLMFHLSSVLHPKLFSSDHFESKREGVEMLRILCQAPIYDGISWRDTHPYLVAQTVAFTVAEETNESVLRVVGRVRGSRAFSVNQLVHIPGIGDFPIHKLKTLGGRSRASEMDVDSSQLVFSNPQEREKLFDFSKVLANDVEDQFKTKSNESSETEAGKMKLLVKVPKGTSAYQAKIIYEAGLAEVVSDAEDEENVDEKASMETKVQSAEPLGVDDESSEEEEYEIIDINDQEDSKRQKDREERESEQAMEAFSEIQKRRLEQQEPLSKCFPDACEIPEEQTARARYAKYRGVESLRTSEWDCESDAYPAWMNSIFQFGNFKLSMKRAVTVNSEEVELSSFKPGALIEMDLELGHIQTESSEALALTCLVEKTRNQNAVLAVFGLLAHEQKYSILNFSMQSSIPAEVSNIKIRSKDPVLMVSGFRRLEVAPIYSDASHGQNLHTLHRHMPRDRTFTASIVAPIAYPPCPISLFRLRPDCPGAPKVSLVATGSLESVNPNRIILKRISFIGYPFKIHQRTCTVRFMFFNPSDVNWFRPIELVTSRSMCRGHIKESLGTHGYMKCRFDKQVHQNEEIAMHLYKRVFPKWTTRPCNQTVLAIENDRAEEEKMDISMAN